MSQIVKHGIRQFDGNGLHEICPKSLHSASVILQRQYRNTGALRNILRGMDLASTLSIQLDGTAAILLNGQRYTLVPDMTLLAVPADRVGQDWWQESPTRYRVTNMETFPWRVWSQGFTVKQP